MSCTTEPTSDDARNIAPSTPVSAVDALLSSTSVRMPVGQLDRAFATKLSTRRHQYKVLFLKHLDLSGCKYITDAGLRVVSTMKRLVRLNLEGCSIAGSSLIDFPKLTRLSLRGCINITDATNLGLHGLRSVTYEERSRIPTLSKLQHLDLSGCRKITGCSLYYMPMLTHLNLSGCENVTDEGLRGISSLAALQRLDLSRCLCITGSSICNLPALTHLVLQECKRVKGEGLRGISTLAQLRYLDLSGCVNDHALEHVQHAEPNTHLPLRLQQSGPFESARL
ncbi:receptor-type protein kinase, putative [Bodo saltans]|uniref:Receptor-type protein kinase, putative n=1 Tax=Bodo saltans TaxID=75058 RepID=A0A0S4KNJ6_BODSA|nr:receptor-type protein kinase, putative [Bodo saltans]|eukprot:CUI15109.1 receptor-type protein kinase, putative [Bodo saltans]